MVVALKLFEYDDWSGVVNGMKTSICLVTLFWSIYAHSAVVPKQQVDVVNEVLFRLDDYVATDYDRDVFNYVYPAVEEYLPKSFLDLVKTSVISKNDLFVMSRLVGLEAQQLDVDIDEDKLARVNTKLKKNSFGAEKNIYLKNETLLLLQVVEFSEIKKTQFQEKNALLAWLQVLKRKYALAWKSNEFKDSNKIGL